MTDEVRSKISSSALLCALFCKRGALLGAIAEAMSACIGQLKMLGG